MLFLMRFEFVFEFAPENGLKEHKTTKYGTIPNEKCFFYLLTKNAKRKNIPLKIVPDLSQL